MLPGCSFRCYHLFSHIRNKFVIKQTNKQKKKKKENQSKQNKTSETKQKTFIFYSMVWVAQPPIPVYERLLSPGEGVGNFFC